MTRNTKTVIALTALAAAVSSAFAQEAPSVAGSVTIGGISSNVDSQNPFRFYEYRDLTNGVTGGFDLRSIGNGPWWFRGFAENLGRDDQFIEFKGGRSGTFKFQLYDDDIIHNTTYNALTPFTGVGTRNLTFPGATASTNVSTWNRFDYSVKHRNYGGFAEGQASPDSPLYFRIDAKEKHSEGLRTLGAAGTSPGGPSYELPAPIDWKTTDISGEIGYTTRKMHLSVSYLYSKFEDANQFLLWRTPFATAGATTEMSTIAMDNKLERWSANAIFRGMPLDSTLALRAVHTKVTNDFPLA